ncbi:tRNA (adenosine(37)-N6)-threonylcarbamoyltransferase complex ATPase subunit type 1 TsaE [Orbaceae bacterium ac157xtp]
MVEILELVDEQATITLGEKLANVCKHALAKHDRAIVIFLEGDLGAGKTTFSRGFLRGFGYKGNVKSPTYNLVEPYEFEGFSIYHFDLYRLADPEELEFMGMRDYLSKRGICLIEWPEMAGNALPKVDIMLELSYFENGRKATVTISSIIATEFLD